MRESRSEHVSEVRVYFKFLIFYKRSYLSNNYHTAFRSLIVNVTTADKHNFLSAINPSLNLPD